MYLVKEQELPSHQMKALRQIKRGMAGEVYAVHQAGEDSQDIQAVITHIGQIVSHRIGQREQYTARNLVFGLRGLQKTISVRCSLRKAERSFFCSGYLFVFLDANKSFIADSTAFDKA